MVTSFCGLVEGTGGWITPPEMYFPKGARLPSLANIADELVVAVQAGAPVRHWLRRASRELAVLEDWRGHVDWPHRSICQAPLTVVAPMASDPILFGIDDQIAWVDQKWVARYGAVDYRGQFNYSLDVTRGYQAECAPAGTGGPRSKGAAEDAVGFLRLLSSVEIRLCVARHGVVAFLQHVTSQWSEGRAAIKAAGTKPRTSSGSGRFSALKLLAALIRFTPGFFGAHKVDARNLP